MRMISRRGLPLGPLLHAYRAAGVPSIAELHRLPGLGDRFAAILGASARFFYADFLDRAKPDAFRDALVRFYKATVFPALHAETLARQAGFLRYALGHLLLGRDPAPRRLAACLSSAGTYRVPGLGPSFWSALLQALSPARFPGWTPAVRAGIDRSGGRTFQDARPAEELYGELIDLHARIRAARPEMTSLHIDHFLSQIAHMRGRDLSSGSAGLMHCPVTTILRKLRVRRPLRDRLKERGRDIALGQEKLERALTEHNARLLSDALALADPLGAGRSNLDWGRSAGMLLNAAGRLWRSELPLDDLATMWSEERLPGGGLWLGAAVLHLRDPQQFVPFGDLHRAGQAQLDEGVDPGDPAAERYRLANAVGLWLREEHGVHPLEVPDVFAAFAERDEASDLPPLSLGSFEDSPLPGFTGFCVDTFAFLGELAHENRRDWMLAQRDRYQFAVRWPIAELCGDLTRRFVEPVLRGVHGWALDTRCRTGHALTSICKNVFGKSSPYTSTLWITFCLEGHTRGARRASAQLFVCLSPGGLRWGLRLGRAAGEHRRRLVENVKRFGPALWQVLHDNGAAEQCLFGPADAPEHLKRLTDITGLLAWAESRTLEVSASLPAGDALLRNEDLVGAIVLTLDRLVPLFACAVETDPGPALARIGGPAFTSAEALLPADFCRQTYLSTDWLQKAHDLLSLKKQLILQGVPGTGKTHVARCLAQFLARGCDDAIRLVQFHPAYSYEEFVEGIRVRSVANEGRHDITYPVEDGLLCAFAAQAAQRPSQPHVLVIDEINRGNLPRIFGELLYLLEYRGQAVELPCSRRLLRLPENLFILATMNASDRSIAVVDQALRRRFSFLHMEPDEAVLAAWLRAHPPAEGPGLIPKVLGLFARLNERLRAEAGPHAQVGHSFFMVHQLDEARLVMIWQHHIRPLLDEIFAGQPGRAAAYDTLLQRDAARPRPARAGSKASS